MANNIKYLKTKIGAGVITAAMMIAVPFVVDREGESLDSYRDVVGVWTICNGETLGVKPGMRKTREECKQLTDSRVGQFMSEVAASIEVPVTPPELAAHTSFAYNIGIGGWDAQKRRWNGYKGSKALTLLNSGKHAEACRAMANWYTAGGRDCRVRANGCYGLINRRNDEIRLCLSGVQ